MIAIHEEVQEKVYQEVVELFERSNDSNLNYKDLTQLKYTEMVIKESMRLFSPAFGIFREVKSDVELGNDFHPLFIQLQKHPNYFLGFNNVKLPKGTNLIINLYSMHRKENIWGNNANIFDPSHFSSENVRKHHAYSFIPFANGTRMCIGNKFSMILMKLLVAQYVKNFKFTTSLKFDDVKIRAGVTIKLLGKHLVKIENRFENEA
jgi:cytochrome P450 family 313